MLSEPPAVAGGCADCGLSMADCGRIASCLLIRNRQSAFRNPETRPLPQAVLTCCFLARGSLLDGCGEDNPADDADDACRDKRRLRRKLPEQSADGRRRCDREATHEVLE